MGSSIMDSVWYPIMKICSSYFYQVRHFSRDAVPLSTAKYDPKWYHNNGSKHTLFYDKRGVLNGCRFECFVPGHSCDDLCSGKPCKETPDSCNFLSAYRDQIYHLNFNQVIKALKKQERVFMEALDVPEITFVLLFHEKPDNPCSERVIVKQWFHDNGYELNEWIK